LKNIRLLLSVVSILLLITITWFVDIPHNISDDFSIIIEDRNNNILDASISKDQQWRFELPDSSINIKYVKALLTFEDKRFYYHKGVDIISLLRAFKLNILSGGIKSGGSTIDMQVIRLSRKNPPRTIIEKIKEVFRALFLDFKYTKTDILRMYASGAPYGGNVVGIEAASYRYFNHSSVQLSWAESCLLAVLPNNPSAIHPGRKQVTQITLA
jgi:penicillin-binding protein 1C